MRRTTAQRSAAVFQRGACALWISWIIGAGAALAYEPAWPRLASQPSVLSHPAPGALDAVAPHVGAVPPADRFANVWPNQLASDPLAANAGCQGYFFRYDLLLFTSTAPRDVVLGDPASEHEAIIDGQSVYLSNTLTLHWDDFPVDAAHRIEFGRLCGQHGWLTNVWWGRQSMDIFAAGVGMVFSDPDDYLWGYDDPNDPPVEFPVHFDEVTARSDLRLFSSETMGVRRADWSTPLHGFDFFYGVRYLSLEDDFSVAGAGGVLGDSAWGAEVKNRIVGPQIGGRWFISRGFATFGVEGRFMPGANFRRARLDGQIASNAAPGEPGGPALLSPNAFSSVSDKTDFSAVGEIRLDAAFHAYDWLAFRAGYNVLLVGGVGRASDRVIYELPALGLDDTNSRQTVFLGALTLGVELRH